jgi:hypothetical protein
MNETGNCVDPSSLLLNKVLGDSFRMDFLADLYQLFCNDNKHREKNGMLPDYERNIFWDLISKELPLTASHIAILRKKVVQKVFQRKSAKNSKHIFNVNLKDKQDESKEVHVELVKHKLRQIRLGYKFVAIDNPVVHARELKDEKHYKYVNILPWILIMWISNDILQLLQQYHEQYLRLRSVEIEESKGRGHPGENLATSKQDGKEYQPSKTLQLLPKKSCDGYRRNQGKKKLKPNTKLEIIKRCRQLHDNFHTGIAKAVNSLIGGEQGYIDLKDEVIGYENTFGRDIHNALVDGTPFTTIWFNSKTRTKDKNHRDDNAHGICILFCLKEYKGGDINIQDPNNIDDVIKIHMKPGMFLIGRWSRCTHWNDSVHKNGERHSYVLYFNNHLFYKKTVFVPANERYWYKQCEEMMARLKIAWSKERAKKRMMKIAEEKKSNEKKHKQEMESKKMNVKKLKKA